MGDLTKNFNWSEFASPDGAPVPAALKPNMVRLARNLEVLRASLGGKAISIHSGYRSPAYNASLPGAAPFSRHMRAEAADFSVAGVSNAAVYCKVEELIAAGKMREGGLGFYSGHLHYDIRGTVARWTGTGVSRPACPPPAAPTPPPPPPIDEEEQMTKELEAQMRVSQIFAQATLLASHGQQLPDKLKKQIQWLTAG